MPRKGDEIIELFDDLGIIKFASKSIDEFAEKATKNASKTKVMLGKFDNGSSTSYIARAGTEHTYFDMGEVWEDIYNIVNQNDEEIWRINRKFIDKQKALGKEFYLSHNPSSATGYYYRELQYLTQPVNQGGLGGQIVDLGNNLWKVIW